MNATTDVSLVPLASGGDARISGSVQADDPGGVLVVAEQGGVAVSTSITGSEGNFTLYNVPGGSTTVTGYRAGLYAAPVMVDQTADGVMDVVLTGSTDQLATVTGSVNIVNAPGGSSTSVILVLASTFDMENARGESPAGLRAAPVTSSFSIADVPPGRYAVLPRSRTTASSATPTMGIAGTQIVFVDVAGSDQAISQSFKVTGALDVMSPGADGLEVVTSVPQLVFAQDSSEDGYEVRVYDAFGNMVYDDAMLPAGMGSRPITYDLSGRVDLMAGMIYQFRAWSFGRGHRLSATEDLRGVFQYQP